MSREPLSIKLTLSKTQDDTNTEFFLMSDGARNLICKTQIPRSGEATLYNVLGKRFATVKALGNVQIEGLSSRPLKEWLIQTARYKVNFLTPILRI